MRKLKPCGTRAAYARHLRNGEVPCDECKAANLERVYNAPSGKKARQIDPHNLEVKAMDRLIAERPPRITWRKNRRGIWIAASVHDPHAETVAERKRDIRVYAPLDPVEPAAKPVPECTNPTLLAAARTDI